LDTYPVNGKCHGVCKKCGAEKDFIGDDRFIEEIWSKIMARGRGKYAIEDEIDLPLETEIWGQPVL
jgi:hypothetical protein